MACPPLSKMRRIGHVNDNDIWRNPCNNSIKIKIVKLFTYFVKKLNYLDVMCAHFSRPFFFFLIKIGK